jgi:hypothetical protein
MTYSECCACDAHACGYWGDRAYCRTCLEDAKKDHPNAHRCPICRKVQGPQIMWRGELCGDCKKLAKKPRTSAVLKERKR